VTDDISGGAYAIVNETNGDLYVGSTRNFVTRWNTHRWALKRGKSTCRILQSAWNKYGASAFAFRILEVVEPISRETLLACEQRFIDGLKPHYNVRLKAATPYEWHDSEETRHRKSLAFKGKPCPGLVGRPVSPRFAQMLANGRAKRLRMIAEGTYEHPKQTVEVRAIIAHAAKSQWEALTPAQRAERGRAVSRGRRLSDKPRTPSLTQSATQITMWLGASPDAREARLASAKSSNWRNNPAIPRPAGMGVRYVADRNKWRATITIAGKLKSLGCYRTRDEAVAARTAAEADLTN
jgi:group I intron endonuclease